MDGRTGSGKHNSNRHDGRRRETHQNHQLVKYPLLCVALLLVLTGGGFTEEPLIDHQPVICSIRSKNPRICAYVADDGEIKKVRVYFRADEQEAFYWSPMSFDGIQYCATLPVPKKSVRGVEYYLWAIDDNFESQRTRTHKIHLTPESPCEYPVFDEDPVRTSSLAVHATSPKQGKEIKEFEKVGIIQFVPAAKRKK